MKRINFMAAGLTLLVLLFAGCNNSTNPQNNEDDSEIQDEPFIMKNALVVYSLDGSYESGSFGDSILNSCGKKETSLTSSVNTVISTPSAFLEQSESEIEELANYVSNGKNLVIIAPSISQMGEICKKLAVYKNNIVSVNGFASTEEDDETYKAIGIRGKNVTYLYDDNVESEPEENETEVVNEEGTVSESENNQSVSAARTAEDASDESSDDLMADSLCDWLKEVTFVQSVSAKDEMSAQEFTHTFTAKSYDKKSKMVVSIVDDVWAMCELDKQKDYYIVRETITCPNQDLGYANTWDDNKKIGPYFKRLYVNHGKIGSNTQIIRDVSPQTSQGSTSYSSGMSFSLSGNIGFNSNGPTGGTTAGISFSKSTSRSIPDISIVYTQDQTGTNWSFIAPAPDTGWSGLSTYGNDVPAISRNTAIFDTYCIYELDSSEAGSNPVFSSRVSACIQNVYGELSGFLNSKLTTHTQGMIYSINVKDHIAPPSRYAKDYIMGFEAPDGLSISDRATLSSYLDTTFGSNWQNAKTYYTVIENDTTSVESNFDNAMIRFNKNKTELKNKGFSGTWTFYVKAADADDQVYIKTETITF